MTQQDKVALRAIWTDYRKLGMPVDQLKRKIMWLKLLADIEQEPVFETLLPDQRHAYALQRWRDLIENRTSDW